MMFASRKCSFLCIITLTLVSLVFSLLHSLPPTVADDSDPHRITLRIGTTDSVISDSVQPKVDYQSGEDIPATARFEATGTQVNLVRPKLRITVPKISPVDPSNPHTNDNFLTKPGFVDSSRAIDKIDGEDAHSWWVEYEYTDIKGGTALEYPFPFSFKNFVTPEGTQVTPKFTLYSNAGDILQEVSITFTAHSSGEYRPEKKAFEWPRWRSDDDGENVQGDKRWVNRHNYSYRDDASYQAGKPKLLTTAADWNKDYEICARPISSGGSSNGTGEYRAQTVTFIDTLPSGAIPHPDTLRNGWTWDKQTGTLTLKRTTASFGSNPLCVRALLTFPSLPISTDGQPVREDLSNAQIFTNRVNIVMDEDLPTRKALPEAKWDHVYRITDSIDRFHERHEVLFDKWPHDNYHEPKTYHNGRFFHWDRPVTFPDSPRPQQGLQWKIRFMNRDNGSSWDTNTPPRGGTHSFLKEFYDSEFDSRLYLNAVKLNIDSAGQWGSDLSMQSVRERIIAARPSMIGVKDDGGEVVLAENMTDLPDWQFYFNDTERTYAGWKIKFASPLEVENYDLQLDVWAMPRASELQDWESGKYTVAQRYNNVANVTWEQGRWTLREETAPDGTKKYVNDQLVMDGHGDRSRRNDDNHIRVSPIDLGLRIGADRNHAVAYDNCERRLGATTKLTPENCGRLRAFTVELKNDSKAGGSTDPIKNLKQIVLLPSGVEYRYTNRQRTDGWHNSASKPIIEPQVVPNFRNTGKTALIYSFGDIPRNSPWRENVWTELVLDTTLYAAEGPNNPVEFYSTWDNNEGLSGFKPRADIYEDELDLDGDGNTAEKFLKTTRMITFTPPRELISKKMISLDAQNWTMEAPAQDLGGNIYYKLSVSNGDRVPAKNIHLIDVLPALNDHTIVDGELPDGTIGYAPRWWNKFDETTGESTHVQHSGYITPLVMAIEDTPGNDTANQKFTYQYQITAQGEDLESVRDGQWLTKGEIIEHFGSDSPETWAQVKSVRAKMKPGQQLGEKESSEIILKSRIPYTEQTRALNSGTKSVNSTAVSTTNVGYLEANVVHSEIVKYTADGIVFKDIDRDGNARADEDRLSDYKVTLVDAATGNTATNPDGSEIPSVFTDKNGHFSFEVYTRGTYRFKFDKRNSDEFTRMGDGEKTIASHVKICGTPEADVTSANSNLCATDAAPHNNIGYSTPFTLDPSNRHDTRNAGLVSTRRNVSIKKVDQDNANLSGVTFRLTWKEPLSAGSAPDTPVAPQEGTTDAEGLLTFKNLPYGLYILEETDVPEGLQGLTSPVELRVSQDPYAVDDQGNPLPWYKVVNTVIKGKVKVKKVDADTDQPLSGAVFELRDSQGKVKYTSEPSGDDGTVIIKDVLFGDYILAEKTPPTHYNLSHETRPVQIRSHGQEITWDTPYRNSIFKGTIKLKKINSDTRGPIAGAHFGLFLPGAAADTPPLSRAVSSSEGIVQFTGVPYGTYKIREIQAAEGYVSSPSKEIDAAITAHDQILDLTSTPVENTIMKSTVKVTKVDFDDQTRKLKGVTFGLFVKNGNNIADNPAHTAVTDSDGVATFSDVPYVTYLLRETATIAGYELSTSTSEVTVNTNGGTVNAGTVTNRLIIGSIKAKKVDADDPTAPLAGVRFGLFAKTDSGISENPLHEAVTNGEGIVEFTRIPQGNYILKEISTIAGYNLNASDTRDVTITARDQLIDLTAQAFTNAHIRGSVSVLKQESKANTPLAGTRFALFAKDAHGTVAPKPSYEAVTDTNGIAQFSGVVYGNYLLRETQPTQGYNPSTETGRDIAITVEGEHIDLSGSPFVNDIITSTVKVTKIDQEQPLLFLGGVEFGLFKRNADGSYANTPAYRASTDPSGVASFADVEYGAYQLRETAPLVNYNPTAITREVRVTTQGEEISLGEITNQIKKGTVLFYKKDADDQTRPVVGAEFALKQGDEVKYTAISDSSGLVRFPSVNYGEYTLVETKAPENYNLASQWSTHVSITEEGQIVDKGTVTNALKKGRVTLTKFSADDKTGIPGATFTLKQNGETLHEGTTAADGTLTFTDVAYGDYILVETKAPTGYIASDQKISVSIREQDQTVALGNIDNHAIRGEITLTKLDADTRLPLEGVSFELVSPDGSLLDTQRSNNEGIVRFSGVRYGSYVIREAAPLEGYVASNNTFQATINNANQVVHIGEITNRKIKASVKVAKVDADSKAPLANVTFALYPLEIFKDNSTAENTQPDSTANAGTAPMAGFLEKETGIRTDASDAQNKPVDLSVTPAYTAVTNDSGYAQFDNIPYGEYVLVEYRAAQGYNPSPEVGGRRISIVEDGLLIDAGSPFENKVIRADILLRKVNASGMPLSGATFELRQENGEVVDSSTSDAEGRVLFNNVRYGRYVLVETRAPIGYQLSTEKIPVAVTAEGSTVDAGQVINEAIPAVKHKLSYTGAKVDTALMTALLMTTAGIALLLWRRRTRQ